MTVCHCCLFIFFGCDSFSITRFLVRTGVCFFFVWYLSVFFANNYKTFSQISLFLNRNNNVIIENFVMFIWKRAKVSYTACESWSHIIITNVGVAEFASIKTSKAKLSDLRVNEMKTKWSFEFVAFPFSFALILLFILKFPWLTNLSVHNRKIKQGQAELQFSSSQIINMSVCNIHTHTRTHLFHLTFKF